VLRQRGGGTGGQQRCRRYGCEQEKAAMTATGKSRTAQAPARPSGARCPCSCRSAARTGCRPACRARVGPSSWDAVCPPRARPCVQHGALQRSICSSNCFVPGRFAPAASRRGKLAFHRFSRPRVWARLGSWEALCWTFPFTPRGRTARRLARSPARATG
jgi:hypothetical protein